ncbi:MAG: hypothetical protein IJU29_07930, partial [Oscillospiraceae bacterium]|nr:hypothetical protein [Oscillospiraceae bacterium]
REWRANFASAKAQKPQEYFVYFKVFGTQAGAKFAARRARRLIQRFLKEALIPNQRKSLNGGIELFSAVRIYSAFPKLHFHAEMQRIFCCALSNSHEKKPQFGKFSGELRVIQT